MKDNDKLKDLMNDYRNSVKAELTNEELSEVDAYINKISEDFSTVFDMLARIQENESVLSELKEQFDQHAREEKWLEKLLKTS
mgnify:CR=1 FL=1